MESRLAMVREIERGVEPEEAAQRYGVDRSCVYKWLARYRREGVEGLKELPRTPEYSPRKTPQKIVDALLELKRKYPIYGPAKLVTILERDNGMKIAISTAGTILSNHGLVKKHRRRRNGAGPVEHPGYEVGGPGDSMTTDYKGQFRMESGRLCYPLTIADPASRFVFAIEAHEAISTARAREVFERVFREHGVPRQIISDNGSPFCSTKSLGGLTQLSRWWIAQGAVPIRIPPGCPQHNGRHERMHRTLKQAIQGDPQRTLRAQQRMFDAFRHEFNHVRPHQSLGQQTPASVVRPYPMEYVETPSPMEYGEIYEARSVRSDGRIKWKGEFVYVSEALVGDRIGLLEIDDELWEIHFGPVKIGYLDEQRMKAINQRPERSPAEAINEPDLAPDGSEPDADD